MNDDGQHRQSPGAGSYDDGQRRGDSKAKVGQTRGGDQAMSVGKPDAKADISTEVFVDGITEDSGQYPDSDD